MNQTQVETKEVTKEAAKTAKQEIGTPSKPSPGRSESKAALRKREPAPPPVLRFSPTAWAKLLYFRDRSDTEVGGFGVTAPKDSLLVQEFVTVKQQVTSVSVSFDDGAVADLFDSQVDAGRKPDEFARIWLHTHPGDSPQPSVVDEETFERVFGRCEWAAMFVLGRTGKTYARLRFNVGPGGEAEIPVEVDYRRPFGPSDHEAWETEYRAHVRKEELCWGTRLLDKAMPVAFGADAYDPWDAQDLVGAFEDLDVEDRRAVLDELASRPELWDEVEEGIPW